MSHPPNDRPTAPVHAEGAGSAPAATGESAMENTLVTAAALQRLAYETYFEFAGLPEAVGSGPGRIAVERYLAAWAREQSGASAPGGAPSAPTAAQVENLLAFFAGLEVVERRRGPVPHAAKTALTSLFLGEGASHDRGASNVWHLFSVMESDLDLLAVERGRAEFFESELGESLVATFVTDVRGKTALDTIGHLATVYGDTVGARYRSMRAHVQTTLSRQLQRRPATISEHEWAEVRAGLVRLLSSDFPPLRADSAAAMCHADLSDAATAFIREFWQREVVDAYSGHALQPFMVGTWAHGLLMPGPLVGVLESAGIEPARWSDVIEGYYAHHMTDFPAGLLAAGGVERAPDFAALAAAGLLSAGAASALGAQFDAALSFYGRYGADFRTGRTAHFDGERMQRLFDDAAPLRAATRALSASARRQLVADNAGQFAEVPRGLALAIRKWLDITEADFKPATNGGLIDSLVIGREGRTGAMRRYALAELPVMADSAAAALERIAEGHPFFATLARTSAQLGYRVDLTRPSLPTARDRAEEARLGARLEAVAREREDFEVPAAVAAAGPLSVTDWFRAQPANKDWIIRSLVAN